jgi:hypothetical protein
MKTLVPLSKFIKNTVGENGHHINPSEAIAKLDEIKRYTHFLESKPDLSMFVPCSGPGKAVLDETEMSKEDYQMAVDNLIFRDFKVTLEDGKPLRINDGVVSVFWYDSITNYWRLPRGIHTLNDLTMYGIAMVENFKV